MTSIYILAIMLATFELDIFPIHAINPTKKPKNRAKNDSPIVMPVPDRKEL